MSKLPEKRKYQDTWELLKVEKVLCLRIHLAEKLSDAQRRAQLATIRKAVQKEKYYDFQYKDIYPRAKLDSVINVAEGTITIILAPEPPELEELF